MEEQDTHGETETNEEENRDRKQSGTEARRRKGGRRWIKMEEEGTETCGKREEERKMKRTKPGAIARSGDPPRSRWPPKREEKERSKVRASGPDTDRFSRSRDTETRKRRRERKRERKKDKRIYLSAQREYPC